jgi:predicted RNA-binding protein with PIN domain
VTDTPEALKGPLPEPVRQRVVALASDTLGELTAEEVPASLRPFARFAPGRRARLAATPLAAALETDIVFRQRVSERLRTAVPDLADAVGHGLAPPAADPLDVAAAAFLLRPVGWAKIVDDVADHLERESAAQTSGADAETVARLRDQVSAARSEARADRDRLRAELASLKEENTTLRKTLRQARDRAAAAEKEAARNAELAAETRDQAAADAARADAELRRIRSRLSDVEASLEAARRSAREGRDVASARLRLLMDTLVDAAQGLRRELALPPVSTRPADTVAAHAPASSGAAAAGPEDAASLETLLGLPQVHLVVDGYNVTKTAWPTLTLETQRNRLVTGLGGLAGRTGAEVTCVFDGAKLDVTPAVAVPRGVRVRFSPAGVTADEVIRRLVAAEPPGRPVVVVSSDREVADGVRRAGARPVAATALVRALSR